MLYLQRNLSAAERALRLGLGACAAFAAYGFAAPGWVQATGFMAAGMLAGTALVGFCPACALFGRKPLGRRP